MTSIRRTLLAWLLLGLAAVAVLATLATYFGTRREIGELFDLQLKQLAYSTRIDDLLGGRAPNPLPRDGRSNSGVSEIVTQIWDRKGVLVYWSSRAPACPCRRPKAIRPSRRTAASGASTRTSMATTRCRSRTRSTSGARSPRRRRCARCCRSPRSFRFSAC
jgi:hypothetical protein